MTGSNRNEGRAWRERLRLVMGWEGGLRL